MDGAWRLGPVVGASSGILVVLELNRAKLPKYTCCDSTSPPIVEQIKWFKLQTRKGTKELHPLLRGKLGKGTTANDEMTLLMIVDADHEDERKSQSHRIVTS